MTLAATGQQRRCRGGIVRWEGPRPADEPDEIETQRAELATLERANELRDARIELARVKSARSKARDPFTTCRDCDALLVSGDEACPCVRLWCRQQEAEWMRSAA